MSSTTIGRRILLVEDNQDVGSSLVDLLRHCGHHVQLAFDGAQALEVVKQHQLDVILLDIGLPGIDGYEVARRLRQDPELNQVVLIALTGMQDNDRASREAGFDYHLVKPVRLQTLEHIFSTMNQDH